jgi:hypothetical protein
MLNYIKQPRNLTEYKLMRGVTDFGNLRQYNLFESGYSFLSVIKVPVFMDKLATKYPDTVGILLKNYVHVLEYEFRGLDGLDDITTDTLELTNGISTLNMIGKVNQQSASTVSMRFFEKSGSTLTKFNEYYLRGIRDPKTQAKTYHGLLQDATSGIQAGFENEVFTLLYYVTDNTYREIERAVLLLCAQPPKAETSIYNSEKGTIEHKEITIDMNCFPVTGDAVNKKAKEMLDYLNLDSNPNKLILNSTDFNYTGISSIGDKIDAMKSESSKY